MINAANLPPVPGSRPAPTELVERIATGGTTVLAVRRDGVGPRDVVRAIEGAGLQGSFAWRRLDDFRRHPLEPVGHDPLDVACLVIEDPRDYSAHADVTAAIRRRNERGQTTVVICHRRPPWQVRRLGTGLRSPYRGIALLSGRQSLSAGDVRRLERLTRRRADVAADVLAVAPEHARAISAALRVGGSWKKFAESFVDLLLAQADRVTIEAACRVVANGYIEPQAAQDCDHGLLAAWLVPLDRGWYMARAPWIDVVAKGLWRHVDRLPETMVNGKELDSRPVTNARNAVVDEPSEGVGDGPWCDVVPVGHHCGLVVDEVVVAAGPETMPPLDAMTGAVSTDNAVDELLIKARLLGVFEVEIAGEVMTEWAGQLGPGVLRYVLAQPKRRCPRDVLLDVFWPDVDPERARNRLQVALSSLRRSLREAGCDVNLVEYHDGWYRICPTLAIQLDVDEFEDLIGRGREAEMAHSPDAADLYSEAVALYRGDFCLDAPYDEWTVLPRESLRLRYIDLLDRLAQLRIDQGRAAECIEVAQLILRQDACREDAHRLLMRCYGLQGRVQQVVRQFELCRKALRDGIAANPLPVTVEVYRAARAQAMELRSSDWGLSSPNAAA